ncbi:MAG: ABC transporter ATP-binding protein [Thermoanaerobaculales bacterium]
MSTAKLLAALLRECLHYPLRLAFALASLLGLGLAQLALPWIVKTWVEGPLGHGGAGDIRAPVLAASAVVALVAVFLFVSRALLASVNQRMLERLRNAAVSRLMKSRPPAVREYSTGDLMSRVFQDAGMLSGFVENVFKRLLGDGILALGALAMMFVLHPRLALATCFLAPLVGLLLGRLGVVIRRWGTVSQESMGRLGGTLQEQLQGFTTIKGYQRESAEAQRFAGENSAYRHRAVMAEGWTALLIALVFLAAASGFVLAVWYGSLEVAAGRLTAGGLLAFCLYAGQTVEPLRRLAEIHGLLQRSLGAAERLLELGELEVEPSEGVGESGTWLAPRPVAGSPSGPSAAAPDASARLVVPASLVCEAVRFRHRDTQPLLEGLDLRVAAGERVALVGASGGGKTTLANLLVRYQEPASGRILLDGLDILEEAVGVLRRKVCVVEQEPFLFSGPLLDNLRYGAPDASPALVDAAVRLTGLEVLRTAQPEGLLAGFAEAGRDVSGGQKQRVALARAIVRDPALLVLDEATSALDSEAEAEILTALESWFAQRTVIVMAHRLSTIRRVPRIAVLYEGRIVADGSFETLAKGNAVFRALFAEQLEAAGLLGQTPTFMRALGAAASPAGDGLTNP